MKGNLISQGQKNSLLSKIFSFHRFARFSSTLQMLENKNALTLIPVNVSQLFGKTATTFLVFYVLFWNEIHLSLVFLPKSKHSFMGGRHLFILFFSNCHRRQTIQLEGIPKKVFLVDLPKSLCLCLFLCLSLCQVWCLTAYLQSPFMDLDAESTYPKVSGAVQWLRPGFCFQLSDNGKPPKSIYSSSIYILFIVLTFGHTLLGNSIVYRNHQVCDG